MKFPQPPSDFTGAAYRYLGAVSAALRGLPQVSYFTQQTPNGTVQGYTGDLAIYIGSTSTLSRFWVNQSDTSNVPSYQSWGLLTANYVPPVTVKTVAIPVASPYAVLTTDVMVYTAPDALYAPGTDQAITLPTGGSFGTGNSLAIKKVGTGSNNCVITAAASQTIDGASVFTLVAGAVRSAALICSGSTRWYVVSTTSGL